MSKKVGALDPLSQSAEQDIIIDPLSAAFTVDPLAGSLSASTLPPEVGSAFFYLSAAWGTWSVSACRGALFPVAILLLLTLPCLAFSL